MMRTGCVALVAAAGMFLAGGAGAQSPRLVPVTVVDHLSNGQQEETIAVYFEGVLAGTLHVDASHPDDSFQAKVPGLADMSFTLCGKLLRREGDGTLSAHRIDNGGSLSGYEGASLAAITMGDVLFSLEDETGRGATTVKPGPSCAAAVS